MIPERRQQRPERHRLQWLPAVLLSGYGILYFAELTGDSIAWALEGSRVAGAEAVLYGVPLLACSVLFWISAGQALPD